MMFKNPHGPSGFARQWRDALRQGAKLRHRDDAVAAAEAKRLRRNSKRAAEQARAVRAS